MEDVKINNSYKITKDVLKVLSILGVISSCIGIILAVKLYSEGDIDFYNGVLLAIYGIVLFISSQIGLATIETAENTYQILMKLSKDSKPTGTTSTYYTPTKKQPLKVGDRIKTFKGYVIVKAETGCTTGGKPFKNILEAERWVNDTIYSEREREE